MLLYVDSFTGCLQVVQKLFLLKNQREPCSQLSWYKILFLISQQIYILLQGYPGPLRLFGALVNSTRMCLHEILSLLVSERAFCATACCWVLSYTSWVPCRTKLWAEFPIELEVVGWTHTFEQCSSSIGCICNGVQDASMNKELGMTRRVKSGVGWILKHCLNSNASACCFSRAAGEI